jgi:hypothetical protein
LLFFYQEQTLAKGMIKIPASLAKRAKQIQVLLMDVDGTMTDGSVILLSQSDGSALEIKSFDAHDGQGLTLAHTAGIRTGVITGRESPALLRRANEMKMEFIYRRWRMWAMIFRICRSCAASGWLSRSATPSSK